MRKLTPFIIALFLLNQTAAWGGNLPAGYESVSGSSSYNVSEDGSTGTLTAGDAVTIGQWNQGFNIAAGHTFNANLPANGVHLSRDITANPSEIFGTLNVPQGRFFLVNTSGVYFAPGSSVNAAGLVASALDMNDQDFLNGNYRFAQGADAASVVNAGTMTIGAGGVALLGGSVENRGLIVANESSVVLASGKEMTLSLDPAGLLSVLVTKEVDQVVVAPDGVSVVEDGVRQAGIIRTDGGRVLLTAEAARGIFKRLVNQEGLIEARSVQNRNGVVELVANGEVEINGSISTGDLKIGQETVVNAGNAEFLIDHDWINKGEFNGQASSVEFTGEGKQHHVYGANHFYDLAASGADRVIRFEAGKPQTIYGKFTLQGEYARLVKIHSTIEGELYDIDVRGDYALDFVDVRDSRQLGSDEVLITRSHSAGNIFGWNADPDWNGNGGDNNWSTGANWDTGIAPGAGNTVTFNGTAVPNGDKDSTVDALFGGSIANLTIGVGYTGTITLARSLTLTGAGTNTLTQNGGTLDLNGQTLSMDNNFALTGGILQATGGGTLTVTEDFVQTGGVVNAGSATFNLNRDFLLSAGTFNADSGNIFFDEEVTISGTGIFNEGTSAVTLDGASGTIDITTSETFNNLTINSTGTKTITAGDTLIVLGTLTLIDGVVNTGTLEAQGNVDVEAAFNSGSASLVFTGTNNQNFDLTGATNLFNGNVTVNKTAGTVTLLSDLIMDQAGQDFTLTDGTFDRDGFNHTVADQFNVQGGTYSASAGTIDINGAFTLSGGTFNASSDTTSVAGAFTHTAGGTFNHNSGSFILDGGSATLDITTSETFNNLTINSTGTKTITAGDTLIALGTLTLMDGVVNTGTLEAQGNVDVEAAFNSGSASLVFTGTNNQNFDLTGATNLFNGNVTVNKTAGTVTLLSDLTMDAGGQDLTVTSGTLDLGTNSLSVTDQLILDGGTLTQGAGTITATNDFVQSSGTFNGGAGNFDINDSFTLSGGTFTASSGTMFVGGNFTHTAGGTFSHNSGTVIFDSGNDTIDVSITETFGSVVFMNGVKIVAAGDTLIVTGTLDLTDGSINTGTVVAQGDINQASTFDGGSGLLLINGTGSQLFTGSATTTAGNLPDLTINKASGTLTLAGTIRTSGSGAGAWTYTTGTIDPGASTVIFNGTNTISGTHSLFNVDFRGTGAKTINGGDSLTVLGDLLLEDGSINTGTVAAQGDITQESTFDGGSGLLLINGTGAQLFTGNATTAAGNLPDLTIDKSSGTLTIAGTIRTSGSGAGAWTYTTGTIDPGASTVIFNGTNTITGTHSLFNVDLRGAGAKTVSSGGTLTVLNALNLDDGDLNAGTIDAKGNVTHGALFDGGTGTLSITGAAVRAIDLTGGGQMPNVILNAPNVTMNGSLAGTVTFDGGFTVQDGIFMGDAGDMNLNSFFTLEGGSFTAPSGTMFVAGGWTHTLGGAFTHNSGTVELDGGTAAIDVTVTETFNNLTISAGTKNISAGDTLLTLGLLNLVNGNIHTGTLEARGDVTFGASLDATTAPLIFTGTAAQLFDPGPTLNAFDSDITIDKTAGTVTLAADLGMNDTGQDLTIILGEMDLAGFNFTQTGGGAVLDLQGGTLTQGAGNITVSSFSQSGGIFAVGTGALDVNGNFTLSGGVFTAPPPGSSFTVSGDFSNTGGMFDANFGELILDGGDQAFSGSTVFYDLTKIVAVTQTLTFENGSTQIIIGTTTLQGAPGNRLLLRSSANGSQWYIDPQGTRAIDYVDVMDSVNLNPVFILPSHSIDSGNNVRWFPEPPPTAGELLASEYTATHFPLFHTFFSEANDTGTLQGLLQGRGLKEEYGSSWISEIDEKLFDEAFYSMHGASPLPGDTIKPHDRLELAIWLPKSPRSEATA